ncbi:Cobalamin synthase [compost metagenome]
MRDLSIALVFLTRLPLPLTGEVDGRDIARSSRYYPLVGALVGLFVAACFTLASGPFPPLLAATLAATASTLMTGAFHEDALGDVADAFGGGMTRERKLEIMKDSRQGTYGVLAIVLALLLRIQAYALIPMAHAVPVFVACHALSRVGLVWMLWRLPTARQDGLGADAKSLTWREPLIATALGALLATSLLGYAGIMAAIATGIAALLVSYVSLRQIGGITGDVLGSSQQVGELFALLGLIALCSSGLPWVAPWLP